MRWSLCLPWLCSFFACGSIWFDLVIGIAQHTRSDWSLVGLPLHSKIGFGFSFLGCVMLAMYSGIERTKILAVAIASMSITNIFLNWVLVFGKFGLSRWGFEVLHGLQTLQKLFPLRFLLLDCCINDWFQDSRFSILRRLVVNFFLKSIGRLYRLSFKRLSPWLHGFCFYSRWAKIGVNGLGCFGTGKKSIHSFGVTSYAFASTTNTAIGNLVGKEAMMRLFPLSNEW